MNERGVSMSSVGDGLKYLYREFFLRDLLSFITPGAMIVGSIFIYVYGLSDAINIFSRIRLLVYVPIFCVCYVVGFATQCFGQWVGVIRFFNRDLYCDRSEEKDGEEADCPDKNILRGNMDCLQDKKAHWNRVVNFLKATKDCEDVKRTWERMVVFKQMCANCAFSSLFAGVMLFLRYLKAGSSMSLIASIIALVTAPILLYGHYQHRNQQMVIENKILHPWMLDRI